MAVIHSAYGACMVSRNIYEGTGKLKWCVRESSTRDVDNGWRFMSDLDTDEYLADNSNWCILAFETLVEIEPAVLGIYDMPIGTEATLLYEGNRRYFVDSISGALIG